MNRNSHVARAVRHALVVGAITSVAGPAFAQQAPAGDTQGEVLEAIVVTGSRIRQPNLESTSPVTQVTAADITTQGVTRVEDLINQLPQAFAAQNATVANGSTGTATVDLRGLGSSRTLVLVDGRRMPYGGVTNSAADLNQIPSQLIERVEVLTGGASAVYGSDAISGVVNFITKKNFEGVEIEAGYNFYQHNNSYDGPGAVKLRQVIANRAATNPAQFRLPDDSVTDGFGRQASILIGLNSPDGRGNFTAYATVEDNDEVLQRDRDYSACSLGANPTVSFACGGSGTAFPGTFTQNFVTNYTVTDQNTFRPFVSATDQYNFGPVNHYLRPSTRYNFGASGHYELSEKADVYTQLMFTDYRSVAQIAPGGIFFDSSTINCDNPFLSAQQRNLLLDVNNPDPALRSLPFCTPANIAAGAAAPLYIGRRNVEGGGRQQSFNNQSFRAVVGVRGNAFAGWDYDVAVQRASVKATQTTLNYFVIDRILLALDAVQGPNGPQCRDATARAGGCVPYNPFVPNGVTPEALAYLQAPGIQSGTIDQEIYTASLTGDLGEYGIKLPTATDPVAVAFGVEYRRDKLENEVDALQSTNRLSGAGGATIGITGATTVKDVFMEARVPLIQGAAFADDLSLDTAYRFSDYGNVDTDTYKLGLQWAPVEDVKLRGSYQRAVRAANIVELFTAQGFNLFDADTDPCAGTFNTAGVQTAPPTATLAQCVATGVPAANYGSIALVSPAGQYQRTQGGNPDLVPEKSDTYTAGIIFTPRFAPGLVMSVDWFNIKIEDTISVFGAQNTLDQCYDANDAAACAKVIRNPAGLLWTGSGSVIDTNTNIGSLETSGIDVNASYAGLEIGGFGSLSFNLQGTYLEELVTFNGPGTTPFDCAGKFGNNCVSTSSGIPAPKWRHQFRIGYQTPFDLDVALTWRYMSKTELFNGAANRIDRELGSQSYLDLAGTYAFSDKIGFTVGVNNVLDRDPPLSASVGTTGNGNTYPQTYDALGRYIFGRLRVGF